MCLGQRPGFGGPHVCHRQTVQLPLAGGENDPKGEAGFKRSRDESKTRGLEKYIQ